MPPRQKKPTPEPVAALFDELLTIICVGAEDEINRLKAIAAASTAAGAANGGSKATTIGSAKQFWLPDLGNIDAWAARVLARTLAEEGRPTDLTVTERDYLRGLARHP